MSTGESELVRAGLHELVAPLLARIRSQRTNPSDARVLREFVERVEPAEPVLHEGGDEARDLIRRLQSEAKAECLWALGHPTELGGGGLPFMDGTAEVGDIAVVLATASALTLVFASLTVRLYRRA